MKTTELNIRLVSVAATLTAFAVTAFADVATPSPTRLPKAPDMPPAYDWGSTIGTGLWIVAGIIVVVWIGLKLSKRSSK